MPGLSTVYKPKGQTHTPEYAARITVPRRPWSLSRAYSTSVQEGWGPKSDSLCDNIPAQARDMVRVRPGIQVAMGPEGNQRKICPAVANLDLENSSHCSPIKIISWQ